MSQGFAREFALKHPVLLAVAGLGLWWWSREFHLNGSKVSSAARGGKLASEYPSVNPVKPIRDAAGDYPTAGGGIKKPCNGYYDENGILNIPICY